MKRSKNRLIAIILLALIASSSLVACSNQPASNAETKNGDTTTTINTDTSGSTNSKDTSVINDETTSKQTLSFTPKKFDGEIFTILCRDDGAAGAWDTYDVTSNEYNGSTINDAVYTRRLKVEDTFGITLASQTIGTANLMTQAQTSILSDSSDFNVVLTDIQRCASLANNQCLLDIYSLPHIDMSRDYWDSYVAKTSTVNGKLFFAMGDINIIDNSATWSVLFNKNLAKDHNLPDHYELVNSGKWTIDTLTQNSVTVTTDLNGDGKFTPEDQWGTVNQYECVIALFASSGGLTVSKDADDLPVLCAGDENMVNMLENVLTFETNKEAQIKADDYSNAGYSDIWNDICIFPFGEGRALYYISPLSSLDSLRDMEDELGILPLPKGSESQDSYISSLQYNNATGYCVPKNIKEDEYEKYGMILEAMAYESTETLTSAYYETTLKRKYTTDKESSAMLDLIFNTRIVDIGFIYNWGDMQGFYQSLAGENSKGFASSFAARQKSLKKEIKRFIDKTLA